MKYTPYSNRASRGGFTLTEVMVACFILAVGISGFGIGYLSAMRTNRLAKNHYQATCLARNRIQRARSVSFTSIPLLAETDRVIDADGNADANGLFRRTTAVAQTATSNTLDIAVSVRYPDAKNAPHKTPVTMRTIISSVMDD
jgi:prepilin-type N-terminal cleavage/methylation domain-containing protein